LYNAVGVYAWQLRPLWHAMQHRPEQVEERDIMRGGVGLALLSAVAWSFWGLFSKLSANRGVPPGTFAFLSSCASFAMITLSYVGQRGPLPKAPLGLFFALLSGVCGAIGMLLFAQAIRLGNAAIIVTLTATYPALTVLLSLVLLQERVSLLNAAGVLLVILGVILVAR
jgi:transporter family protein